MNGSSTASLSQRKRTSKPTLNWVTVALAYAVLEIAQTNAIDIESSIINLGGNAECTSPDTTGGVFRQTRPITRLQQQQHCESSLTV